MIPSTCGQSPAGDWPFDRERTRKARVALCHGADRVENLIAAVELVIDEIDWSTRRHVVVKPNLVVHDRPAAVTHRDAVDTVLRLIRRRYDGRLSVAEGSAIRPTREVFASEGYHELAESYDAELVDLNADATQALVVLGPRGHRQRVHVARTTLESDCRVSLALPKTHDTVLVTLGIKNMVMGSVANRDLTPQVGRGRFTPWRRRRGNDKLAMHRGYAGTNINLALLAQPLWPHLVIIDGFHAMEGAGPTDGRPVAWGIAVASADALAADALTAELMGFNLSDVGYLSYCAELGLGCGSASAMQIVGSAPPERVARVFEPHPTHLEQRQWQTPAAAQWLPGLGTAR